MKQRVKSGGGGKSYLSWWANPKNRQKVYDSDKADAEELKQQSESSNNINS